MSHNSSNSTGKARENFLQIMGMVQSDPSN